MTDKDKKFVDDYRQRLASVNSVFEAKELGASITLSLQSQVDLMEAWLAKNCAKYIDLAEVRFGQYSDLDYKLKRIMPQMELGETVGTSFYELPFQKR